MESPALVTVAALDYLAAWKMVTSQLRTEMDKALFDTWVQTLTPLSFNDHVFKVGACNPYGRDWVKNRLQNRIVRILEGVLNQDVALEVTISNGFYQQDAIPVSDPPAGLNSQGGQVEAAQPDERSEPKTKAVETGSSRKVLLQRAYGSERARLIQPERGLFLTLYFFNNWLPLIGHSAVATILAARSMCYWNPKTGELRNTVETTMAELAEKAAVSVRTVKDVLAMDLVQTYFLRYKVRRNFTPNGIRTAGIWLQVRMDDPLTPLDQEEHHLPEETRWYSADFDDDENDFPQ